MHKIKTNPEMKRNIFEMKKVHLLNNARFSIPCFPFLRNVQWLLLQNKMMEKPLLSYDHKSTNYFEMNTGNWWRDAEILMKKDILNELYPHRKNEHEDMIKHNHSIFNDHILIPIIMFIDSTHVSKNGRLKAEAVLCSIGTIPIKHRKQKKAWFNLGFVPNFSIDDIEDDILYQQSLHTLLYEMEMACNNRRGISMDIYSLPYSQKIHFEVAFVIGDMSGHDSLCGHYKGYSKSVQRPCRACNVTFDDLDDSYHVCKNINATDIYEVVKQTIEIRKKGIHGTLINADEKCKSISQKQLIPTFSKFRFGGNHGGIFQCTPPETIHALLLGVIQNIFECMFNFKVNEVVESVNNDDSISIDASSKNSEVNENKKKHPRRM